MGSDHWVGLHSNSNFWQETKIGNISGDSEGTQASYVYDYDLMHPLGHRVRKNVDLMHCETLTLPLR